MLREPTFLILASVAPSPLHGYAVISRVEELSNGRVHLRAGTLYAALDRLVTEGQLEIDREEIVGGRLRRYFRITNSGLSVLQEAAAHLESNAAAARAQLQLRPEAGLL